MDQTRFCGRAQTGYDFIKLDPWYRVLDLDEVDEISATITLRWMEESDLGRLGDLDRLETVRTGYQVQDGNLTSHTIG